MPHVSRSTEEKCVKRYSLSYNFLTIKMNYMYTLKIITETMQLIYIFIYPYTQGISRILAKTLAILIASSLLFI